MSFYTASIAQILSPRRRHKVLGAGMCRKAYYSPKHNVVFKIDQECYGSMSTQMRREIDKIDQLTHEELEIFPVVAIETYKERTVMVMKRAKLYPDYRLNADWYEGREEILKSLEHYRSYNKLVLDNLEQVADFIIKHQVQDIHRNNVGVIGTKLVIIDMGY